MEELLAIIYMGAFHCQSFFYLAERTRVLVHLRLYLGFRHAADAVVFWEAELRVKRDAGFVDPEVLLDLPRCAFYNQSGLEWTEDAFDVFWLYGSAPVTLPVHWVD